MNLAILHYHLNPGGVTRVIANHLLSLEATAAAGDRLRVMLLSDGQTRGWPTEVGEQLSSIDVVMRTIPSLRYQDRPGASTARMLDDICSALSVQGFAPQDTVLHAHNHSLGKNAGYPAALQKLSGQGYALLLQPHDFAEDYRPANYRHLRESFDVDDLSNHVYFQGPRIHYATLNRRDFDILRAAGVPEERLHFLPNPVPEMPDLPPREEARSALAQEFGIPGRTEYVLYPVRGIRRKNIGELLLLSTLKMEERNAPVFAVTLDPLNPAATPYYERWRSLAAEVDLPCRFGVGGEGGLSFVQNLAAADRIVTTSVAEGFGMVFLESWLAARPLVGRNLPEITVDFVDAGLRLDALYERLSIPVEWVGRDKIIDAVHAACHHVYADYGLPVPGRDEAAAVIDGRTSNGTIDFGFLDEPLQEAVIRRAAGSTMDRDTVFGMNPKLQDWECIGTPRIEANQAVIREQYSLLASGQRLRRIYASLLNSSAGRIEAPASGQIILRSFLSLGRFRLIHT